MAPLDPSLVLALYVLDRKDGVRVNHLTVSSNRQIVEWYDDYEKWVGRSV